MELERERLDSADELDELAGARRAARKGSRHGWSASGVLLRTRRVGRFGRPAIVNGAAGLVVAPGTRPISVVGFTIAGGRIVEIDLIADPDKLRRAFVPED
jgi:hypothetical protein